MNAIPITLNLPEELVARAREKGLLEDAAAAQVFENEIMRLDDDDDSAWEASLHTKAFAKAFADDGTVNDEMLDARSITVSLSDLKLD